MSNVVTVAKWGRVPNTANVADKFLSCDRFIRSRIVPPPVGSIMFAFKGGKVTITGDTTTISGGDCEVVIRGTFICINGCEQMAADMFCSIHREIEELKSVCLVEQPLRSGVA
jgi:hypothetical protein